MSLQVCPLTESFKSHDGRQILAELARPGMYTVQASSLLYTFPKNCFPVVHKQAMLLEALSNRLHGLPSRLTGGAEAVEAEHRVLLRGLLKDLAAVDFQSLISLWALLKCQMHASMNVHTT